MEDFSEIRKLLGEVNSSEITDKFLKDRINFVSSSFTHPELKTERFMRSIMAYFRNNWVIGNTPDLSEIDCLIMEGIVFDSDESIESYCFSEEEALNKI